MAGIDKKITQSEISTFKDCKRRWWLEYYRGLGLIERPLTGAAPLGTMIHECLECMYKRSCNPLDRLRELADSVYAAVEAGELIYFDGAEYEKQLALCRAILEGFVDWAAETGIDVDYKVLAVEEKLEVDVSDSFVMAQGWQSVSLMGKLDVLVERESDGAVFNRDWKSVQNLEEGRLTQSQQFRFYCTIMKLLGQDGVLGGQRVSLRKVKRTGNAKPPFYGLEEAVYTDKNLHRMYEEVWGVSSDIAELTDKLDAGADPGVVAYPRPDKSCHWKCPFYMPCSMFDDGSDVESMLARYYVKRNPLERYGNVS